MKKKQRVFWGTIAMLMAMMFSMTGCPSDGGGSGSGDGNIGPITEETSGRETVTGSNITLIDYRGMENPTSINYPQTSGNGYTFSVSGGKLSFALNTSPMQDVVNYKDSSSMVFGSCYWDEVTAIPASGVGIVYVPRFFTPDYDRGTYIIDRGASIDSTNYSIEYIYVSADLSLSKTAAAHSGSFFLPLKQGWNLVQVEKSFSGITTTVKIADKNLPWYIHEK